MSDAEPPAPYEPAPLYVEHLGPESYPGKQRGIYGGSLWLEPSFHGLQWPYMRKSGVGVSGSIWVDSGYERIARWVNELPDTALLLQQGRAALRVTPTYTNGRFFIQGQVELIGNHCQATSPVCTTSGTVDTDDLWIRVGHWNIWDIKVGRFEGWEIFHTGMGLDINTLERQGAQQTGFNAPGGLAAPDYYGVNYLHYRPAEGLGVGYAAAHWYATERLRFELLAELGANDVSNVGYTYYGGRPTMIFDAGMFKLKVGGEYEKRQGDTRSYDASSGKKEASKLERTRKGGGAAIQFVFDPTIEFGANFAVAQQADYPTTNGAPSDINTYTRMTVGGFANLRLADLWILGAGADFTWQTDAVRYNGNDTPNYTAHLQGFLALQYLLAKQLYIKGVLGYARADFQTSDPNIPIWSNTMYSARIRLMYLY